jgi:excisionase family DNA binding protein
MAEQQLLDTAAVVAWLDVPARTVEDWRHRGGGPRFVKVGRHVRYRREDVTHWLNAHTRAGCTA